MSIDMTKKPGRPFGTFTKYKKTHPALALKVLSEGKLLCHVAAEIGVDRDTVRNWIKDPRKTQFRDAINLGLARSEAINADRLAMIARDGRGNVSAQLRIMEWGFGWKNVQTVENRDEVKEMSDKDIDKKIAELQSADNVVKFVKSPESK